MTSRSTLRLAACLAACLPIVTIAGQAPAPLKRASAADLKGGAKVYATYCARCHGIDGTGGMGPPLARPRLRRAHDEAAILDVLFNGIPGTSMMAAWSLSEREMQQVTAYVRSLGRRKAEPLPGDPARGRAVYARLGCASCHIIDGAGAGMGPELTTIGLQRGAAFLRESILDPVASRPERAVPYEPYTFPAYVVVRARPRGGAEIAGVRLNEDAFTIQLRDQQGRVHSLRKADLERLEPDPGASLMPGYRDQLAGSDLDDLVAYLMTRQGER
jgi:putative heme-binding domain-containing protein